MCVNTSLDMKRHPITALKLCLVLTSGLVVWACTKQNATLKDADFAGEYALISVDGKPVPADITHDGTALQVRSGKFTIKADGTCSTKTVFVPPSGTEVAREVSASYSKDGSKLSMQWKGAGKTVGTVEGNTFTMDNEGTTFLYKK